MAVDSCNGAGSIVAPRLREALGVEVVPKTLRQRVSFARGEPVRKTSPVSARRCGNTVRDVGFRAGHGCDRLADSLGTRRGHWRGVYVGAATRYVSVMNVDQLSPTFDDQRLDAVASGFDCPVYGRRLAKPTSLQRWCGQQAVIGGEGNGGVYLPADQLRA